MSRKFNSKSQKWNSHTYQTAAATTYILPTIMIQTEEERIGSHIARHGKHTMLEKFYYFFVNESFLSHEHGQW